MDSVIVFGLSFAALVVIVASFWYLFQTVRVIWGYSPLIAIAAAILSPFIHIVFYFIPKDEFDQYDKGLFKKYFLSIAALVILGIIVSTVIPSIIQQDQAYDIASEVDTSQPWEWDIRAENQDEPIELAEPETDDKAAELHFEAIYQAHPDADKVMESPEFEVWLQGKQPGEQEKITRILREGIASEVIYVFSTFKKDMEIYRTNEYQTKRDKAQALAQKQYLEKKKRQQEAMKSNAEKYYNRQVQSQLSVDSNVASIQAPTSRSLSYSERQERERLKASLSKPYSGSNGELTKSQKEALASLESGQPMSPQPIGNSAPSSIASCDSSGCWDTNGTRYNKGAGNTYFPSTGGVCQNIGNQMNCH